MSLNNSFKDLKSLKLNLKVSSPFSWLLSGLSTFFASWESSSSKVLSNDFMPNYFFLLSTVSNCTLILPSIFFSLFKSPSSVISFFNSLLKMENTQI